MDAELLTRLTEISEECDWCAEMVEGCTHCGQKAFLVSIACAWAFDFGRDEVWKIERAGLLAGLNYP